MSRQGTSVVLGAQVTQYQPTRGTGRYSAAQVRAVTLAGGETIAHVEQDPSLDTAPLDTAGRPLLRPHLAGPPPSSDVRVYHVMEPFAERPIDRIWPRWARRRHVALAVTLYDLIPLQDPELLGFDVRERTRYEARLELVRRADAVLAISETTAAEAADRLGVRDDQLHVVSAASPLPPPGADSKRASIGELQTALPGLRPGFVLYVGAVHEPRKNCERLLAAYAMLPRELVDRHQLVLVVSDLGGSERRLADEVKALGLQGRTLILERIGDHELEGLYTSCVLTVFPSLAEGFGLPVLEAMQLGAPTIVSDIPPLRALVPEAAARFEPCSVRSIGSALRMGLTDAGLRAHLSAEGRRTAAGYSWDVVADRSLIAYAAAARRMAPCRQRPRKVTPALAIVSPMAPDQTGVSAYTAQLAAALSTYATISLYAERQPAPDSVLFRAGVRCLTVDELFGRIHLDPPTLPPLFCIGNSPFHLRTWRALARFGGDVLLHDVLLDGLHGSLAQSGRQPWSPGLEEVVPVQNVMHRAVAARARRLLVHSRYAQTLVTSAVPERAGDVHVVPFAAPPGWRAPREPAPPVLVTSLYAAENRKFFEAAAQVKRSVPELQVQLLGRISPQTAQAAQRLMSEFGLSGDVEITGWLDEDEYRARLRRGTISLQLRDGDRDHGECSSSIFDGLAAGLPTIVTDNGSFAELPRDVVWHVPDDIDATGLAELVGTLLRAPDVLAATRERALDFVEDRSFEHAANAIWDVLSDTAAETELEATEPRAAP